MMHAIKRKRTLQKYIREWRRRSTKLIVLTGKRCAGKDVFAAYLKRKYPDIRHFRIAEAPILIARILHIPPERRVLHALFGVNRLLFPILGESAYKRRVAQILDKKNPHCALLQATRTKEEYDEFIRKRKGLLVGIVADPQIRFPRAQYDAGRKEEKRDERNMTFAEFMGDPKRETGEYSPIEREIDWIVKRAHFTIGNNFSERQPFFREIDRMMSLLGLRKRGGSQL